jgi:hypothetical protein
MRKILFRRRVSLAFRIVLAPYGCIVRQVEGLGVAMVGYNIASVNAIARDVGAAAIIFNSALISGSRRLRW